MNRITKAFFRILFNTRIYLNTIFSQFRLDPDFIIIGVQRGGTTSLYNYLIKHPNILPAKRKEIHYFDWNYDKGIKWYKAFFPLKLTKKLMHLITKGKILTGEASPDYIFTPYVPKKIAKLYPSAKLIVLLRDPVDRAYSQYFHQLKKVKSETLSFEKALEMEESRIREESGGYLNYNFQNCSYLNRGKYAEQLEIWFKYFPKKQILILKSEEMYKNPAKTFNTVCDFLQIPPYNKINFKTYNGNSYVKMDKSLRQKLHDYFESHNHKLYALINKDYHW